ncbi:MAG: hypothetical protein AMXMBFR83_10760 [Phycisphaerae bacterium]
MPLTANRDLDRYVDQELRQLPVRNNVRIYKGAFVGLAAGFARPLVAGDLFAGVAYEEADNTGGADGAISVRVFTSGDFEHALASAARSNNGTVVYASDDSTLTLTAGGNSNLGNQVDVVGTNKILVRLRPWMR